MSGWGTDENSIVRHLAGASKAEVADLIPVYNEEHGNLEAELASECDGIISDDFQQAVLKWLSPPAFGISEERRKDNGGIVTYDFDGA